MLYTAYEWQRAWLAGVGSMAQSGSEWLLSPSNPMALVASSPIIARALEVFAHAATPRGKPEFGLHTTLIDGQHVPVTEEVILEMPFCTLKRFRRDPEHPAMAGRWDPRLLIVAPMSGHYATLLRGTVERMLPDHDVFITDWTDARMVPTEAGRFDLNDYVDYIIEFMDIIGPGAHVLAVCQPTVPTYVAVAHMSAAGHCAVPLTLTMMGGPLDTREAPTSVDDIATERPFAWFEQNVIMKVPAGHPGAGRKVYPGFLQLAGFLSMNLANHMKSHWEMFKHLVEGDDEGASATKAFYDEYRSVCDMTAEFYLQTIDWVFQRQLLARGQFVHHGRVIDPASITRTALLAIEGERDDISGIGQTLAGLHLANKLPEAMKHYHLAEGAGHYGIFNGRRWRDSIAPVVEKFIRAHETAPVTPLSLPIKVEEHLEPEVVPGVELA